jgi:hypothetical protein
MAPSSTGEDRRLSISRAEFESLWGHMITCDECSKENQCVECAEAEAQEAYYTAMEIYDN